MKNKYSSLSEKKLISLCKKEDVHAFDELVSRNREKMYNWILSKAKNVHWAEEIFQRTLIKSWRYIKTFQGGSSYSTWANTIARNLVIDDFRKKQRNREESLEALPSNARRWVDFCQKNSSAKMEGEELLKLTKGFLERLSDNHKEILKSYYFDDLSYKEISEKMGCSMGTVMSRLFYAKKRAKKMIQTDKNFEEFK